MLRLTKAWWMIAWHTINHKMCVANYLQGTSLLVLQFVGHRIHASKPDCGTGWCCCIGCESLSSTLWNLADSMELMMRCCERSYYWVSWCFWPPQQTGLLLRMFFVYKAFGTVWGVTWAFNYDQWVLNYDEWLTSPMFPFACLWAIFLDGLRELSFRIFCSPARKEECENFTFLCPLSFTDTWNLELVPGT